MNGFKTCLIAIDCHFGYWFPLIIIFPSIAADVKKKKTEPNENNNECEYHYAEHNKILSNDTTHNDLKLMIMLCLYALWVLFHFVSM